MKLKKFFAAVLAGAVALSSFTLSASAASSGGGTTATTPADDNVIATDITVSGGKFAYVAPTGTDSAKYDGITEKVKTYTTALECGNYEGVEMTYESSDWGNAKSIALFVNDGTLGWTATSTWSQDSGEKTIRISLTDKAGKNFKEIGYQVVAPDYPKDSTPTDDVNFTGEIKVKSIKLIPKDTVEYADQTITVGDDYTLPGTFDATKVNGYGAKITVNYESSDSNNGIEFQTTDGATVASVSGWGTVGELSKSVLFSDFTSIPATMKLNAWGVKSIKSIVITNDKTKGNVYSVGGTSDPGDDTKGTKVTCVENFWGSAGAEHTADNTNWQGTLNLDIGTTIVSDKTTVADAITALGGKNVIITFKVGSTPKDITPGFNGFMSTWKEGANNNLWDASTEAVKGNDGTYTITLPLATKIADHEGTVKFGIQVAAPYAATTEAFDVYLTDVTAKIDGAGEDPKPEEPTVPKGTKIELKENSWTGGSNWQGTAPLSIDGITNWTTTSAEAVELLGDKELTVSFKVTGALSDGKEFDVSKLNFQGLVQTNDDDAGLWKTYDGTSSNGVYTIKMDGLKEALSKKTGAVYFAVVAYTDGANSTAQVDAYIDEMKCELSGGTETPDKPSEVITKELTLTVVDASGWGNPDVKRAAQINVNLTAKDLVVDSTTFGDVKNGTFTLKDAEVVDVALKGVDVKDTENISFSLFAQWGDDWKWTAGSAAGWKMSDVTGVNNNDVLKVFGYQVNINGTVGGINNMAVGDTVKVTVKYSDLEITGIGGGDKPVTPDKPDDNTGSGTTVGDVTDPTPSTPDKPEETVKVENGNNDTGATVEAPKGAFDTDVKFNAAPVAEETKDDKFTFELNFTDKDGNKVQPKSAVTVKVPVPEALKNLKTVFVYHIEENGTYTEVSCKLENGMVVFSAKSFSKYVVSGKKLDSKGEPAADQPATNNPGTSTTPGSTNEPNANTGAGGVAAVLGVSALAAAALIISKKRK